MNAAWDPYHQWLGIPPAEQPADLYRFLSLKKFEADPRIIQAALDRQIARVRAALTPATSEPARRILEELATAGRYLLDPNSKASYDYVLRAAEPASSFQEEPEPTANPTASSRAPAAPVAQVLNFGPYRPLERITATTMSITYKVAHQESGHHFSLKTLLPAAVKDASLVKRFIREIDIATRLKHPNLIAGVDSGMIQNQPFLVTQYVVGADLAALVKQVGKLPLEHALSYTLQAARGLAHLHEYGVYHRNIKPQSLLVDNQGVLRVANMTIARVESSSPLARDINLTMVGLRMGSPDYLPPEQSLDARVADARADIYSLGCTLYFLLQGQPPFSGKSMMEKVIAHQNLPIPALRGERTDVPDWLELLFQRMLAKRPEERPGTMGEIVATLEQPPSDSWWKRLQGQISRGGNKGAGGGESV
ncbi:MAG: serine/threonine-protein kinase [Planctomycetota bacterium]